MIKMAPPIETHGRSHLNHSPCCCTASPSCCCTASVFSCLVEIFKVTSLKVFDLLTWIGVSCIPLLYLPKIRIGVHSRIVLHDSAFHAHWSRTRTELRLWWDCILFFYTFRCGLLMQILCELQRDSYAVCAHTFTVFLLASTQYTLEMVSNWYTKRKISQ